MGSPVDFGLMTDGADTERLVAGGITIRTTCWVLIRSGTATAATVW